MKVYNDRCVLPTRKSSQCKTPGELIVLSFLIYFFLENNCSWLEKQKPFLSSEGARFALSYPYREFPSETLEISDCLDVCSLSLSIEFCVSFHCVCPLWFWRLFTGVGEMFSQRIRLFLKTSRYSDVIDGLSSCVWKVTYPLHDESIGIFAFTRGGFFFEWWVVASALEPALTDFCSRCILYLENDDFNFQQECFF